MKINYDDPEVESKWLSAQRENVKEYLRTQGVRFRNVPSKPDWFIAPYVSIWRVEPEATPGALAMFAISGDLPTDYLSERSVGDARAAMAAFAARWREVSAFMMRGEEHPTVKIGNPEQRRELGELLSARAGIVQDWADDEEMW